MTYNATFITKETWGAPYLAFLWSEEWGALGGLGRALYRFLRFGMFTVSDKSSGNQGVQVDEVVFWGALGALAAPGEDAGRVHGRGRREPRLWVPPSELRATAMVANMIPPLPAPPSAAAARLVAEAVGLGPEERGRLPQPRAQGKPQGPLVPPPRAPRVPSARPGVPRCAMRVLPRPAQPGAVGARHGAVPG